MQTCPNRFPKTGNVASVVPGPHRGFELLLPFSRPPDDDDDEKMMMVMMKMTTSWLLFFSQYQNMGSKYYKHPKHCMNI